MPKRRANGEGNIRKRKDGRWEGRYTAGYDANGKVITKNVLGRTQVEVKDKLRAAIEDSKKLDPVKAGSYTFEQWLKLWYTVYVEPQVRYSTKEFYHNAIDHHIIPKLGSVKLEKLTMLQIQQFYNELLKSGRVQKKNQPELREHGLSPRMVQCVHVVLNKALEHAVEEKLILVNPAKKCKIPSMPCAITFFVLHEHISLPVADHAHICKLDFFHSRHPCDHLFLFMILPYYIIKGEKRKQPAIAGCRAAPPRRPASLAKLLDPTLRGLFVPFTLPQRLNKAKRK